MVDSSRGRSVTATWRRAVKRRCRIASARRTTAARFVEKRIAGVWGRLRTMRRGGSLLGWIGSDPNSVIQRKRLECRTRHVAIEVAIGMRRPPRVLIHPSITKPAAERRNDAWIAGHRVVSK